MKIFISQKMRNKTEREIWLQRENIKGHWVKEHIDEDLSDLVFIESYRPELAYKDPITSLSQSLAMLDEADIVLVPRTVKENITNFMKENVQPFYASGIGHTSLVLPSISEKLLSVDYLSDCEFEFLIALSYGKKVYTYDENYTFEEA